MNILFISQILLTGDFVRRLSMEGHHVKVYVADEKHRTALDRLVEKTDNWENELPWVGKDGLIVFEDANMGDKQDELRAKGYNVFGGSSLGEKTETDRTFGQQIFKEAGLTTLPVFNFNTAAEAIAHINSHPSAWVVKYSNGHMAKHLCHVGNDMRGADIIAILENATYSKSLNGATISLQERVFGVEIGVARYFNGTDWVGPIEYNLEHTHLFPGGIGPNVDEMGTLAWYDDDEHELLYTKVLAPMKDFLKKSGYRGDYAINCIANGGGVFPLEATARLGSPIIHLQTAFHVSSWGEWLLGIAKGESPSLVWNRGFGVVVSGVTAPFPYPYSTYGDTMLGLPVLIDSQLSKEQLSHIHLDEVASKDGTLSTLYIAGTSGNIVYTTGLGKTVQEARTKAYTIMGKINVPKMFYRHDIGEEFMKSQLPQLQTWGYLQHIT